MATRFYFQSGTNAPVSHSLTNCWSYVSECKSGYWAHVKGTNPVQTGTRVGPWTVGTAAIDMQYVSSPLNAQTIQGGCSGVVMVREFAAGDNVGRIVTVLKVTSREGTGVRGFLLNSGSYSSTGEFVSATSYRSKAIATGTTVSSVTAQQGDRLVIELGYHEQVGATPEAAAKWGENMTDLAFNETNTNDGAGWFEFGQNLTFETSSIFIPNRFMSIIGD